MKMLKGKSLLMSLIISIVVTTLSLLGVLLFNNQKGRDNNSLTSISCVNFTEGNLHRISTSDDLIKLAEDVNNGISHENTQFWLIGDIDFQGESFSGIGGIMSNGSERPFSGQFYGWGHTISNFKLTGHAFFGIISGATIGEFRLHNYTINSTSVDHGCTGGIVGIVGIETSTVASCEVDRVTVNRNCTFGGVVGLVSGITAKLEIEKCMVKNVTFKSGYPSCMGAFVGKADGKNIKISISTSFCNNSDLTKAYGSIINGATVTGAVIENPDDYINKSWSWDSSDQLSTVGGPYNKIDGERDDWYFAPSYHDAVPILRMFVNWTEYTITSSNGVLKDYMAKNGSATAISSDWNTKGAEAENYGTVWLPEGANVTTSQLDTSIRCDGYMLYIEVERGEGVPDYYEFSGWTRTNNAFTGEWVAISCTISFAEITGINYEVYENNALIASKYSFDVKKDTVATCSVNNYASGRIKSVTYSFKDVNNNDIKVSYLTNSTIYYISTYTQISKITEDVSCMVAISIKTYNSNFSAGYYNFKNNIINTEGKL